MGKSSYVVIIFASKPAALTLLDSLDIRAKKDLLLKGVNLFVVRVDDFQSLVHH